METEAVPNWVPTPAALVRIYNRMSEGQQQGFMQDYLDTMAERNRARGLAAALIEADA